MTIHQTDHFDTTHTPLSCTAAPIFDTRGELTAVLDISLLRSPRPKVSQNLAQHLVTASARRIELANLMAQMHSEWVLRFSRSPEFLDVDPEAAIALDASGRILGTTRGGALLLAQAGGVDWRHSPSPIGQPISRYLDMGIDDLPSLTRGRPTEERLVFGRNGSALFAHAIEPQPQAMRRAPPEVLPKPIAGLSGGDPAMAAMQVRAAKLARTTIPILIHGETGSGKEHLARAIHDSSQRAGAFVAINCAAIPEHLIESELFGHTAGAFTGAVAKGRKGLIESADGGTLFLDEIGDMPYPLQSRLLRVIAEREVIPVGGTDSRAVDIKIISASHHDLRKLVAEGRFREDLFYRLNAASLALPALRERTDFEWLLDRLVDERARLAGRPARLSPAARLALIRHGWPGNIRELVNAVDLAVTLCDDETIQPCDLPDFAITHAGPAVAPPGLVALRAPSTEEERAALLAVLAATGWNISEAARRLGVDRTTVHRRMKRLRLDAPN
jgi:transcriptional regulator of acetoin/glycerol metabolism